MASALRYIVERSPDQVRIAFQRILKLCAEQKISRVTLVMPTKRGWEDSIVGEFLGETVAKALSKGRPVGLTNGVTMTLESGQTFRPRAGQGLLVGAHISISNMNKLDDTRSAEAVMYLPWNDEEGQEWQATWNPEIVGPATQSAPLSNLPDPVEKALRRLTDVINLSTGLGHPSDKRHAERTIDNLRADGHLFDPAEIRRWAQRNGWSSKAAAALETIARKRK